jgi:hypothetical protein
MQSLWLD